MMTSFDVNCIDKILLEGRYLVMLRKVKNKIDKYDYEIAVGNLRTGDMFSHSLQDASDVIGINLENQAIDIAYIDKKRNHWWVSFDIAQESEKCLYESNRINTEFPKGGSNAAFAKLENEVQLLIGGMGKITRINGQGQSLEALNGAESSLFNIKAYQNYVFASTIDDKVFMWDINKPAKPQSFESILGEYDVDKNLRLAILPDNKLEIKDLKGGQDVNYDYSFDLANDVHLFDNGILLIGETDSYFQPNDKRLSPTMMKIKKIYIEPQYLIKK